MPTLSDIQAGIRDALVNGDCSAVAPLLSGGSRPEQRLAIHQRHYVASLTRALVERFPATVWLVGSELASVDAIICECAFCTFPDKQAAANEFARVLKPGGRVGLSDITREPGPAGELVDLMAWVACLADAGPPAHTPPGSTTPGCAMWQSKHTMRCSWR